MKALLTGSTGLVGSRCLEQLLEDPDYSEIETWVRRPSMHSHPKLKETVVNFSQPRTLPDRLPEQVFCCLGTTIKVAGSQEAFRAVDVDMVAEIARRAAASGSALFAVVSSVGANAASGNFYLRCKGEMEEAVSASGIPSVVILRPSLLLGARSQFRLGELISKGIMKTLGFLFVGPLRNYKAVEANDVAGTMIREAKKALPGVRIVESERIERLRD